jgi:hypothetical protein
MRLVFEIDAGLLFEQSNLTEEEAEGVEPWCKDTRDDLPDTSLSEAKIITSYDRRVDEEES